MKNSKMKDSKMKDSKMKARNTDRIKRGSRGITMFAAVLLIWATIACNQGVESLDTEALLAGYVVGISTSLTDTQVVGSLTWARCSFGQVWDASVQFCLGSPASVKFCDATDDDCNGGTSTGLLDGNNLLNGGTSTLWTACDTLVLGGRSDWRVPTRAELRTLIVCTAGPSQELIADETGCSSESQPPTIFTTVYPGTPTDTGFFTASSAATTTAWAVNFKNGNILSTVGKAAGRNVRCVAGTSS